MRVQRAQVARGKDGWRIEYHSCKLRAMRSPSRPSQAKTGLGNAALAALSGLSPSSKLLAAIWMGFLILVASGVNGAPTPALAQYLTREPYDGYLFGRLRDFAKHKLNL